VQLPAAWSTPQCASQAGRSYQPRFVDRKLNIREKSATVIAGSASRNATIAARDSVSRIHSRLGLPGAAKWSRCRSRIPKFLDHRGIVLNFPLGALAHLGLARAYALSGEPAKAKTAYQDFLTLWKDADPDIPILKEAKAEYAKLQ